MRVKALIVAAAAMLAATMPPIPRNLPATTARRSSRGSAKNAIVRKMSSMFVDAKSMIPMATVSSMAASVPRQSRDDHGLVIAARDRQA